METALDQAPELQTVRPSPPYRRSANRLLLASIIVLAAALRLARLGHESMWFDETLTVTTARLPLKNVLSSVEMLENMPPLYFYVMNLWVRVAGSSDVAMRLPSAVAGIVAVGVIYALARRIGPQGKEIPFALTSALLLAISRFHIAYCGQARSYSLMLLLALISCWSFVALLAEPSGRQGRWGVTYVVSSSAMLWMQPFSALTLLAQNLFYFGRLLFRVRNELPVRRWALMQGMIALSFGPWVNRQLMAARIGSPWMTMPYVSTALIRYTDSVPLLVEMALLAAVAVVSQWSRRRASGLWFALLLAVVPVALPIWASTPKHPLFVPRYGIASIIGIELVTAWGVVMLPRPAAGVALLAIVVMATPALASDLYHGTTAEHRADVRAAAAWVDAHADPNAGYCCTDGLQSRVFDTYRQRRDLLSISSPQPQSSPQWWLIFQPTASGLEPFVPRGFKLLRIVAFEGVEVAEFRSDGERQ